MVHLAWLWHFVGSNLMSAANLAATQIGSGKIQPQRQHEYQMIQGEAQLRRQLIEQEAQHRYRLVEGDAAMRRQINAYAIEQQVANELRKDFEVFHQGLANKAAEAAARRQIETQEEIDLNRRFADNNPFFDPIGYVQKMLFASYNDERKPILLVSPFWDETAAAAIGDAGGLTHFRTALARAWRRSPWTSDFLLLDGFFKRPLRQTDRDIRVIYECLQDLPVILVHGFLDGHAAYPSLATWNVMPGEGRKLIRVEGEGALPPEGGKLIAPEFRDEIGDRVAMMCGILGAAYYRVREGRPIQRELFVRPSPGCPNGLMSSIRWPRSRQRLRPKGR